MKVKITGYRAGVFDKDGKTISYQYMFISKPLEAYKEADVVSGYETIKVKVCDSIADYIEKYISNYGFLPAEPVDVFSICMDGLRMLNSMSEIIVFAIGFLGGCLVAQGFNFWKW